MTYILHTPLETDAIRISGPEPYPDMKRLLVNSSKTATAPKTTTHHIHHNHHTSHHATRPPTQSRPPLSLKPSKPPQPQPPLRRCSLHSESSTCHVTWPRIGRSGRATIDDRREWARAPFMTAIDTSLAWGGRPSLDSDFSPCPPRS